MSPHQDPATAHDEPTLEQALEQALKRLGAGSFVGGVQNTVTFNIHLSDKAATRLLDLIEHGDVPLALAEGRSGPRFDNARVVLKGDATIHAQSVRVPLASGGVVDGPPLIRLLGSSPLGGRCGMRLDIDGGVHCELPARHDGWHRAGEIEWNDRVRSTTTPPGAPS